MIGEVDNRYQRAQKNRLPDKVIYPWATPDVIGISLDPAEMATIHVIEKHP